MGATATLKSGIRTAVDAGGVSNWQLPGLIDGRVKVLLDTYTGVGSGEDAGSVITFNKIPTGANILAVYIGADTATSGLTISVGDADSATRYGTALTSLQTAGNYLVLAAGVLPGRVVGTSTNDNAIVWTTGGAALTTGVVYKLMVFYSLD